MPHVKHTNLSFYEAFGVERVASTSLVEETAVMSPLSAEIQSNHEVSRFEFVGMLLPMFVFACLIIITSSRHKRWLIAAISNIQYCPGGNHNNFQYTPV